MSRIDKVSVTQLREAAGKDAVDLIDVRTPVEFKEVRALNARNLPLESLDPHAVMKDRSGSSNDPLYVICRSGNRGAIACQMFINAGYINVVNVGGGIEAWDKAGMPVIRGRGIVSLDRQVRIATGLLILLGAALGVFVSPYFIGLLALLGFGLMFAGITDACGMGLILAKMPWNQVKRDGVSCRSHSASCAVDSH
ncbi:MAG: rhodanese-like domain-containing protein [Pirellulaceae bacterium]|nr:rhodanese-like domain-containing protein [Pirellulaceae bacterium]